MTRREKEVLQHLFRDGRASDIDIAREIKTSRSTVAKIRKRLEDENLVLRYIAQPNYPALGINLHAIVLFRWIDFSKKKRLESMIHYIQTLPQVTFFMRGEGINNKSMAIISAHDDFESFESYLQNLKEKWAGDVENLDVFISASDGVYKPYSITDPAVAKLSKDPKQTHIGSF